MIKHNNVKIINLHLHPSSINLETADGRIISLLVITKKIPTSNFVPLYAENNSQIMACVVSYAGHNPYIKLTTKMEEGAIVHNLLSQNPRYKHKQTLGYYKVLPHQKDKLLQIEAYINHSVGELDHFIQEVNNLETFSPEKVKQFYSEGAVTQYTDKFKDERLSLDENKYISGNSYQPYPKKRKLKLQNEKPQQTEQANKRINFNVNENAENSPPQQTILPEPTPPILQEIQPPESPKITIEYEDTSEIQPQPQLATESTLTELNNSHNEDIFNIIKDLNPEEFKQKTALERIEFDKMVDKIKQADKKLNNNYPREISIENQLLLLLFVYYNNKHIGSLLPNGISKSTMSTIDKDVLAIIKNEFSTPQNNAHKQNLSNSNEVKLNNEQTTIKYDKFSQIKNISPEEFQRRIGVSRELFDKMVKTLNKKLDHKPDRSNKTNIISTENKLLMIIRYHRCRLTTLDMIREKYELSKDNLSKMKTKTLELLKDSFRFPDEKDRPETKAKLVKIIDLTQE